MEIVLSLMSSVSNSNPKIVPQYLSQKLSARHERRHVQSCDSSFPSATANYFSKSRLLISCLFHTSPQNGMNRIQRSIVKGVGES
jgi:hypothetical protein